MNEMDIIGEGSAAITYSYGKDKAVKIYKFIHLIFTANRKAESAFRKLIELVTYGTAFSCSQTFSGNSAT